MIGLSNKPTDFLYQSARPCQEGAGPRVKAERYRKREREREKEKEKERGGEREENMEE